MNNSYITPIVSPLCAARSRRKMKSEFSKQLKCFTPGKVGTKARGRASREKVGVIESVEIFGQNRVPSRFFPRLLFSLQFFLFLSRSSLLLRVVHSLRKKWIMLWNYLQLRLISPLWLPWWCFSKRRSSRAKLSLLLGYFSHAWEKIVNHGKQINSYNQRFLITLSSNSALCLVCFSLGCRLAIS